MLALGASHETYVLPPTYADPGTTGQMAHFAALGLLVAASTALAGVLLFRLTARGRLRIELLAGIAVLEVVLFVRWVRRDFDMRAASQPKLQQFFAAHPGDYRFIKADLSNLPLRWHANFLGGYESFRLGRYDEFIQWTQGRDPDETAAVLRVEKYHPLYAMLRCRYVFASIEGQPSSVYPTLPHVLLVKNYEVRAGRDAIFRALEKPGFDPRRTAILETEPHPKPVSAAGTVKIVESSTDDLVIEADVPRSTLLLVTDSYSRDWIATPLAGSAQREYSVLPANYVLRAIPLRAGHHRLRLEYSPAAFRAGRWISLTALLAYCAAVAVWLLRVRARRVV
jgi:hypothetical protein